jgi:signal transduction histidine kinase/DNA-binding response OmpR family regulator
MIWDSIQISKAEIAMHNSFKILVVDDTPEILDITTRTLRKADYTVFEAINGAECMELLHRENPDILLLDVILPDVNGKELAKEIKKMPAFSSVFIFLLSGLKTSTQDISEGLEEGADGYITRPVNSRELLARVASACRIVRAERLSAEALFKYHSLFSCMQEGLYLHEMVYGEEGKPIDYRIIEANPISEELLNIKPEEAIGKLASELFGTDQAPFLEIYTKVVETGEPVSFEKYFAPMKKYFQVSAFSTGKESFATAFYDISLRKVAEEKLKHKNAELHKINAEKDMFFSILAHDLRSPFNSILGFGELLVEEVSEKQYGNIEEYAGVILKSSQNAVNLLSNLMEWAQSQTGRMEFKPENFEIIDLITDVEALFDGIARQKSIVIVNDFPSNANVCADKAMINTVCRNLISNAIKFSKPGGKIVLSIVENPSGILVGVSDNGIGISQQNIEKLFRIDEKYSTAGTHNEKGTGLGLILCKEFIEKHGGNIWVESKENNGSSFYFTLPLRQKKPARHTKYDKLGEALHDEAVSGLKCDSYDLIRRSGIILV